LAYDYIDIIKGWMMTFSSLIGIIIWLDENILCYLWHDNIDVFIWLDDKIDTIIWLDDSIIFFLLYK
jgi:hypothetical protein